MTRGVKLFMHVETGQPVMYQPVIFGLKFKSSPVPNPKFSLFLLFFTMEGQHPLRDSNTLEGLSEFTRTTGVTGSTKVIMKRIN
jgi:hypothetical protein